MSSRKSIQQVVSSTEPVGGSLGDEWLNPTTGVLRKLTLVNGVVQYLDVVTNNYNILQPVSNVKFLDGAIRDANWSAAVGNNIPVRHPDGYLYANYFNTPADKTTGVPSHIAIQTNSDNYIRWNTFAQFRTNLGIIDPITLAASLRANVNISGGGTITVSATGSVLWSARLIVISNGRGSNFATSGYFDINCPTSGTITGVGGAGNQTATAAGIPIGDWHALYYILPIGSAEGSIAANFRIVQFTADLDIPHNWVLICVKNAESGYFHFPNGVNLKVNQNSTNLYTNGGSIVSNVTGTLSTTTTGANTTSLISANIADNDFFRILVGGTATNAGYAEIATADDGNEPIYVRQYTGSFTTLTRTATILDASGNTSFPGSVTAGTNYLGTGATFTAASGAGFGQIKLKSGTGTTGYGVIHRHDGSDYYLLVTANNDADGSWTTARPLTIGLASGNIGLGVTTAASLTVTGDLIVNGTTTTINSTTLTVDDKNLELGSIASPTDVTADGGGITLKGATDKTFNWINATGYWTASNSISAPRFVSTQATGTSPFIVASTTLVTNLNADLLDGLNSATANTASTIVARDASGNFAAGTITATITGSASSLVSLGSVTAETLTADAPAGLTFRQAYSNGYPTTYGNVISLGGAGHNQIFFGWSGVSGSSADNYIRSQRDTGDANWSAWAKIWTDVNDGTGSGLDADLLDGNDSTYFTNATNLASGTVPAARMPAHTGDVTSSVGAVALTLATVNSNVGSFGSSSAIPVLTVNAKGLITAVSTSAVSIPSGSISVTGGDLTLSGTTGTAITNATLATVNSNTGSFGSATSVPIITVNAKGLITAVSTATVTSLPSQTGNTGKFLTTDGSTASWTSTTAAAGGGIQVNNSTISTTYTIPAGQNGFSVGPITVANGTAITVSSGQRWVIL